MTRDNPSIATKVNTMTSSVIILLLGNAQLRCLCHRSVRQEKIIDSGVAELMQRAYLSCLYRGLFSIPPFFFLKSSVSARSFPNSSPKITKSRVQSPCRFVYFFPSTSRFLGSSARNLRRLGCGANVKLLDGMPPRPSQWNFLVRELLLGSRRL